MLEFHLKQKDKLCMVVLRSNIKIFKRVASFICCNFIRLTFMFVEPHSESTFWK